MLLNDSIVPEKQLIHLLQKYAKHSRTFHYIQESICSLITFKYLSYQYEQKHLYEDSQDTNISNHFILPVNLFWSSLVNQLINKKLTEAELIDNLHEAFYNIDISNNNKYQYLFREINLYKNNLVLLDPNFISNIMLIINQIPIHNLNQLFQYIIEEHQKQKNSTNKKILNLDFFNHLIPELVRSELLINANIYDMTCDNDLGLILNKIVTALEIHHNQNFKGNIYGGCIISDYNNNLFTRYRPIGFSLARMNLLLKNQELLCVDVENKKFCFPTLDLIICDGNTLSKYYENHYQEFLHNEKRREIFQKNIYPMMLNSLSSKGKIIIFGDENILSSLNKDFEYHQNIIRLKSGQHVDLIIKLLENGFFRSLFRSNDFEYDYLLLLQKNKNFYEKDIFGINLNLTNHKLSNNNNLQDRSYSPLIKKVIRNYSLRKPNLNNSNFKYSFDEILKKFYYKYLFKTNNFVSFNDIILINSTQFSDKFLYFYNHSKRWLKIILDLFFLYFLGKIILKLLNATSIIIPFIKNYWSTLILGGPLIIYLFSSLTVMSKNIKKYLIKIMAIPNWQFLFLINMIFYLILNWESYIK
ncbi:MAG: hypothetical protein Q8897_01285 [Sweet potato little leaf phytoplasma]|uniref:Uncharacterized protein n=2 Tax=16SrII (Peanut WB group) TaxID=85621 RepID=A0A9K3SUJ6_9MOLU|nr:MULTISPECIES: hypothetical protein [Phytoplasma]MCG3566571.1 hypothetical protein [Sesame phyllody phytoplasma]MDO7987308.1 hypothetical protein [Sweet potato little leaf phytoplasma]MDO8005369.1 hypothetical protein [Sweet potato little leaf phytoplasma]MDO8008807.1 hypothetical protein [Sweet potato little leaf phytoplasma]MDO8020390.1 hypothetical protein [Sweet potato little leaf phytoplasma]